MEEKEIKEKKEAWEFPLATKGGRTKRNQTGGRERKKRKNCWKPVRGIINQTFPTWIHLQFNFHSPRVSQLLSRHGMLMQFPSYRFHRVNCNLPPSPSTSRQGRPPLATIPFPIVKDYRAKGACNKQTSYRTLSNF